MSRTRLRVNLRSVIYNLTRTWHDKIQSSAWYRYVLTTQLNHSASLAKWLSVRLWTQRLWVRVQLYSDFPPASSKEFLDIQATMECGFTLKRVRDMTRTYSQMHRTDKYSQHSPIIWPVWLNGWVFVYELSGCGFESRCCHIKTYWFFPRSYFLHSFFGMSKNPAKNNDLGKTIPWARWARNLGPNVDAK